MSHNIKYDNNKLAEFCSKWRIIDFSLFGSVLREDFGPESDIDVLVTFSSEASWSLFDLVTMEDELKVLFGRDVDLVLRKTIERSKNPYRREAILSTAQSVYATR
jgi:predicted nucleotidyltransferase